MNNENQARKMKDYSFCGPETLAQSGIQPLGDERTMLEAQKRILNFVEAYIAAWGGPATRLDRQAVSARGWSVLPLLSDIPDDAEVKIAAALQDQAIKEFIAVIVSPRLPDPGMVWRVPATVAGIWQFIVHHGGMQVFMVTPDEGCVLFFEGEQFLFLAGPPALLQAVKAAVPDVAAWVTQFASEMDRINGHGEASDLLLHYSANALDA